MDLTLPVLALVLAVLLAALAAYDTRKPHKYPPGPKWYPVIGSFWTFFVLLRQVKYTHFVWERLSSVYGSVVGMRLGRDAIVIISGYPLAKEVLTREEFEGRPDGYLFRLRAFGKRLGVVFTDDAFGQEQRKFILRHLREFGFGRSSMVERIADEAEQFITCLYEKSQENSVGRVNVRAVANICILNSLWGMLASQRFSIHDNQIKQLLDYIHQSFSLQDMSGGLLNQMPFIRFLAPELSTYNKNLEILTNINSFLGEMIEEHKRTFNSENIRDFVDAFLLEIQRNECNTETSFSEQQLLVLMLDMFMAGSDSTSNTLGFAVLYLLHFPHIQTRLAAEIDTVSGDSPPTLQDKSRMPYTEAFLQEVLRFTNIATVSIPHRAKRAVHLDTYILPKDVTILVNLYSVHMDVQYWGDPHCFRPERFLDTDNRLVYDERLIPFGLGRRRCLGETLARPMMFLFLTSLLYHFRVSLPDGELPPPIQPIDGAILAPPQYSCLLTPRRLTHPQREKQSQ